MNSKKIFLSLVIIAFCLPLAACGGIQIQELPKPLTASGTIAADSTRLAPEVGGKILEIKVNKGDIVKAGDMIFRLDDALLQAQRDQSAAAVQVAQAAVDAAKQKLANAQAQYNLTLQAARQQDRTARTAAWKADVPSTFKQPVWYFQKAEQIAALQTEIDAAQMALDSEQANLADVLKKASNDNLVAAEQRLALAQVSYQSANDALTQAKDAKSNKQLVDAAQKTLDAAASELDAANQAYTKMLSTTSATDVLEARARVAAAQARLDSASDAKDKLMTGDQSLQLPLAQTGIDQAKSALAQAQASLAQAQANLKLYDVQLSKMTVSSPVAGAVLSRPLNPGEITAAGATVVEIGSLDQVRLTVYIPEDQYGKIKLGQDVKVSVDTFQGRVFTGSVTHIANQAEFTPRNVQTVESRSTTVYGIEISIPNPNHDLKDGMPADATF
jgi:HlyD family secretion protein